MDSLVLFRLHGFAYFAVSFFLPFLYGSWRFVLFHLLVGPILADRLTVHPNEHAAVWCLLSIALCVSVIKSPLRKFLHVRKWLFYDRLDPLVRDVPWFADNLQEPCAETASED